MTISKTSRITHRINIDGDFYNRREAEIVTALKTFGPMTRDEISKVTGLKLSTVCGRISDLKDRNRVADDKIIYPQGSRQPHSVCELI